MMKEDPYFVHTRSSLTAGRTNHEVVIHDEKKGIPKSNYQPKPKRGEKIEPELDMKQARFEIYKFAQSGLSGLDKQKSQRELAIKLGAVPPKKTALNYKKLKEKLQKDQIKKKESNDLSHLGFVHRQTSSFKNNSRNPRAKLNKKMGIGTAILKNFGTVKMKK
ncbi:Hypothetical protein NTJ_06301 [Nesidiocoris tenuis]|uniref:Uncharacterized protein n=1 Tax=Nesidiocoris tenuis TaxID=355587 RepID=A0ABN7AMN4_9HEMI|nr:Hypothetical protein NTJ_06301 [Nesidiocoris tenuis]